MALNETHLGTIRTMLRDDATITEIAEAFGAPERTVYRCLRRFQLSRVKRGRKAATLTP